MITIAPFLIQISLQRVTSALQIVSAEKPADDASARVLSGARRLQFQDDYAPVAHTPHLSDWLNFGATLLVQVVLSARRNAGHLQLDLARADCL